MGFCTANMQAMAIPWQIIRVLPTRSPTNTPSHPGLSSSMYTADKLLLTVHRTALVLSANVFSISTPSVWCAVSCNCKSIELISTFKRSYLRQGGNVFAGFCLSVCVCVYKITQKVMDGSFWNFEGMSGMIQTTSDSILRVIRQESWILDPFGILPLR